MTTIKCPCGHTIQGTEADDLQRLARAHRDEAHPDLAISDRQIEELVTLALRQTGGTERLPVIGTPELRPATAERLPDFLRFFDFEAFADNPGWASCYCMYPYFEGTTQEWSETTWQDNRAAIAERLGNGRARGYLAYVDGKVAGWCNAAHRPLQANFNRQPEFAVDDAERIGAIACFVIAPPYRRHGIARRLLDAAIEGFRREGLAFVEAYPAREGGSDAHNFHGPLSMYLDAGFTVFREFEQRVMVRKALGV